MLRAGDVVTASSVAARAGLARATIYRHFATMAELTAAAQARPDSFEPQATADLAVLLERAPAHAVAAAVVDQAKMQASGSTAGLYQMDIDGTRLLLAAGDEALPPAIEFHGIGPEIAEEHLEQLRRVVGAAISGSITAPLLLRRRAVGVLVVRGEPDPVALTGVAREAATALEIAARFTDELQRSRRHRETTAAAEVQQLLLPPRVSRLCGLRFAGHVQPGYESGGNWFDYAENEDGAWLAAIDTLGSDERAAAISAVALIAAAISAVALGSLRAVRHAGSTPTDAVQAMHDSISAIGLGDVACSAWVARWHQPSALLFWASAGDLRPLLLHPTRPPAELAGSVGGPLGATLPPRAATNHQRLADGETLVLLSDGMAGGADAVLSEPQLQRVLRASATDPATLIATLMAEVSKSPTTPADDAMALAFAPLALDPQIDDGRA